MLDDLKEINLKPNASMYNTIMAGYFREVTFLDYIFVLALRLLQFLYA